MGFRGEQLVESIRETLGFECLNDTQPTYFCPGGSSTIDLVFTNRPVYNFQLNITPHILRKHCWVEVRWEQSENRQIPKKQKASLRRTHLDVDLLCSHYKVREAQDWCDKGNITEAYKSLVHAITETPGEKHPRRLIHKPWFDAECRTLKTHVMNLRNHGTDELYWAGRRQYRKLLKRKREDYQEDVLKMQK